MVPGTAMPKVPMPSATRELIIAYLTGRYEPTVAADPGAASAPATKTVPLQAAASGAALYGRLCASCHGPRGRGDGPNAPFLPVRPAAHADSAYMSKRSDHRLFDAIYTGGYPLGRSVTMPPFGQSLPSSDIWTLVRHLRELCRCSGPVWSVSRSAP